VRLLRVTGDGRVSALPAQPNEVAALRPSSLS
jgi:hypothetical protein